MADNIKIVADAFKDFDKKIQEKTERRLRTWCKDLVTAAVRFRLGDPEAHNFTGNLLNSIVVCLYKNSEPLEAFFAADEGNVKSAIMRKMSSRNRPYTFTRGDYEGRPSKYTATVPTDKGWGIDDARNFFWSFSPNRGNVYDIVVAYTVEYANWVETQRKTTNYLITLSYARQTGATFMELKSAA